MIPMVTWRSPSPAAQDGRLDRALGHSDLEAARQRLAANFLASAEEGSWMDGSLVDHVNP